VRVNVKLQIMARDRRQTDLDEELLARLATLSAGGQRWLKTALQVIRTEEPPGEEQDRERPSGYLSPPKPRPDRKQPAPDLDDVLTGKGDLREQLDSYPELAEELEGLADVIELLREAGERRRKRGEQILREEMLDEKPPSPKRRRKPAEDREASSDRDDGESWP